MADEATQQDTSDVPAASLSDDAPEGTPPAETPPAGRPPGETVDEAGASGSHRVRCSRVSSAGGTAR